MEMKFTIVILCSILLVFTTIQAAPDGARQPRIFKYGNTVFRRLSSYFRPLVAGTEDTAVKLTRDVQNGSLSAMKMAIESLIFANKMISNLLHYMNGTRMLQNVRNPIRFKSSKSSDS